MSLLDHVYWVIGTAAGALLGNLLVFNTHRVDFALTALFITVFTDQWLRAKDHFAAVAGVLVSVGCRLIFGAERFLIPTMGLLTLILLWRVRKEDAHD